MPTYTEPSTGFSLSLPDSWRTVIAPNEAVVFFAQETLEGLESMNIVVTVEQPPHEFADLESYSWLQIEEFETAQEITRARLLGTRKYRTETEEVFLSSHSFVQNGSVLGNFQIFTINRGIATAITVTGSLNLLEALFGIAHHIIASFSYAQSLYVFKENNSL